MAAPLHLKTNSAELRIRHQHRPLLSLYSLEYIAPATWAPVCAPLQQAATHMDTLRRPLLMHFNHTSFLRGQARAPARSRKGGGDPVPLKNTPPYTCARCITHPRLRKLSEFEIFLEMEELMLPTESRSLRPCGAPGAGSSAPLIVPSQRPRAAGVPSVGCLRSLRLTLGLIVTAGALDSRNAAHCPRRGARRCP